MTALTSVKDARESQHKKRKIGRVEKKDSNEKTTRRRFFLKRKASGKKGKKKSNTTQQKRGPSSNTTQKTGTTNPQGISLLSQHFLFIILPEKKNKQKRKKKIPRKIVVEEESEELEELEEEKTITGKLIINHLALSHNLFKVEEFEKLGIDELCNWLKTEANITEDDVEFVRKARVRGSNIIDLLTDGRNLEEWLKGAKIPPGTSLAIVKAIKSKDLHPS